MCVCEKSLSSPRQLTGEVLWEQTVKQMVFDGAAVSVETREPLWLFGCSFLSQAPRLVPQHAPLRSFELFSLGERLLRGGPAKAAEGHDQEDVTVHC